MGMAKAECTSFSWLVEHTGPIHNPNIMLPADIAKVARSAFRALESSLISLVVNEHCGACPTTFSFVSQRKGCFQPTSGVAHNTCHQERESTSCMYRTMAPSASSHGYA